MKTYALLPFASLWLAACTAASQTPAASVSREQFKQLDWLAGTWRGSGGAYPAFFERYRFINDTTIQMHAFADSTLRRTTDSSLIVWQANRIQSGENVVIEFSPGSARFRRSGASAGGYTFKRVSADEWTATLHPAKAGGQETVYVMRRIGPAERT